MLKVLVVQFGPLAFELVDLELTEPEEVEYANNEGNRGGVVLEDQSCWVFIANVLFINLA